MHFVADEADLRLEHALGQESGCGMTHQVRDLSSIQRQALATVPRLKELNALDTLLRTSASLSEIELRNQPRGNPLRRALCVRDRAPREPDRRERTRGRRHEEKADRSSHDDAIFALSNTV